MSVCLNVLFLLYVIVVTVVRVLLLPCADGCSVSVATLAQCVQSSLHSFRIDGMLSLSAAWLWLMVQHIQSKEVMNTNTLRRAFHCRLQRSLFGNQVVLFTSAPRFCFFLSRAVYLFKMWNEDLECFIDAKQFFGSAVAWQWGFYWFKNEF